MSMIADGILISEGCLLESIDAEFPYPAIRSSVTATGLTICDTPRISWADEDERSD